MTTDNPLWYDYVEPDEAPGRVLLAVARTVDVILRVYWLPERLWQRAVAGSRRS